jgi:hypothetical protein
MANNKYLVCSVRVVGDCDLVQQFLSADVYEVKFNAKTRFHSNFYFASLIQWQLMLKLK